MSSERFIDRVLARIPKQPVTDYFFAHWRHADRPTDEGFGLLPLPGVLPAKLLDCVFDVDHYTGTIPHVSACRAVADQRFEPPQKVRFYQCIKIPLLGEVHHELVLERIGTVQGFDIAIWTMLEPETAALDSKRHIRSQINEGAWLAADGVVGYALSSAPRRDDVGFLKWKALTAGADALAANVIRENIDGMSRWASRR